MTFLVLFNKIIILVVMREICFNDLLILFDAYCIRRWIKSYVLTVDILGIHKS